MSNGHITCTIHTHSAGTISRLSNLHITTRLLSRPGHRWQQQKAFRKHNLYMLAHSYILSSMNATLTRERAQWNIKKLSLVCHRWLFCLQEAQMDTIPKHITYSTCTIPGLVTDLHVFRGDHHMEANHLLIAKCFICPATNGSDELYSSNTIVCYQDLLDGSFSAKTVDVLPRRCDLIDKRNHEHQLGCYHCWKECEKIQLVGNVGRFG